MVKAVLPDTFQENALCWTLAHFYTGPPGSAIFIWCDQQVSDLILIHLHKVNLPRTALAAMLLVASYIFRLCLSDADGQRTGSIQRRVASSRYLHGDVIVCSALLHGSKDELDRVWDDPECLCLA